MTLYNINLYEKQSRKKHSTQWKWCVIFAIKISSETRDMTFQRTQGIYIDVRLFNFENFRSRTEITTCNQVKVSDNNTSPILQESRRGDTPDVNYIPNKRLLREFFQTAVWLHTIGGTNEYCIKSIDTSKLLLRNQQRIWLYGYLKM